MPDGYFTVVLNTNPYTYLGNRPLDLSAAAGLDRQLVAITFRTMRARAVVGAIVRALRGGGVMRPGKTDLDEHDDLSSFTITGERPFPYQVDGDHLGDTRRLAFRYVPDALTLVVP